MDFARAIKDRDADRALERFQNIEERTTLLLNKEALRYARHA